MTALLPARAGGVPMVGAYAEINTMKSRNFELYYRGLNAKFGRRVEDAFNIPTHLSHILTELVI